jgi:putative ABC transport system ATP-binding protein
LNDLRKDYVSEAGLVRALRDVNLSIDRGELVAIVGTSGSGKSTLMNILGCLDRPTVGSYELAGLDVGGRSNDARALVRNRLIGFIFQGFNLLSRTTALENCELPLSYRGVPAAERRKRAIDALAAVGLADRMHHTPNQLSGGQQQRVAIARALVSDPELLLADEPTGNLDTRTSFEVLALLQRLNRERGITIVIVTHEPDIAACASRIIWVRDGRIERDERVAPTDAAAALAKIPVSEAHAMASGGPEVAATEHARPLPKGLIWATLVGLATGAFFGFVYDAVVLGQVGPLIPLICALAGAPWAQARAVRKAQGRPATREQRNRLAFGYSLAVVAIVGLGAIAYGPRSVSAFGASFELAGLTGARLAYFLAGFSGLAVLLFALNVAFVALFSGGAPRARQG